MNVPETIPFPQAGRPHGTGTVRRRRLETVWDTVLGDGHKPTVSSNDHYEGSTQQRPVTNYILLAQSRSARIYTARTNVTALHYTTHVTSRTVRWQKSKSLGRLKATLDDPLGWSFCHVSLESLCGADRRRSPPILPSLPSSFRAEARCPAKSSVHVRDPTPRGSSFT